MAGRIQHWLYGESRAGWEEDHHPSAAEVANHVQALWHDLYGFAAVALCFFVIAQRADPMAAEAALAGATAEDQTFRALVAAACAIGTSSALIVDLIICPCPAARDAKFRALRGIGHFAFLTVQSLTVCTGHLLLSAAAELAVHPAAGIAQSSPLRRAALQLHAACHMNGEWCASLALCLAVLYFPAALLLPQWEEEEVKPWRLRGVTSFKALNLYSHGIAVPCALADLLVVKRPALLAREAPALKLLSTLAVVYAVSYNVLVHLNYNLGAHREQAFAAKSPSMRALDPAAQARAAALKCIPKSPSGNIHGGWPYGFMQELSDLAPPPSGLKRFYVRWPFSLGWVLLPAVGFSAHLLCIRATRHLRAGVA